MLAISPRGGSRRAPLLLGVALLGAMCNMPPLPAALAQPLAGRASGGLPGFALLLELLNRSDVRHELELIPEQVEQLDQLRTTLRARMRSAVVQLEPGADAREQLRAAAQQVHQQLRADLERILLPHQFHRLTQLEWQLRMRGGPAQSLLQPALIEKLELTETQRDAWTARASELEAQYVRQLAQLRQQAHQEMLSLLTAEQRTRFQELLGEPFEFERTATTDSAGASAGQEIAEQPP